MNTEHMPHMPEINVATIEDQLRQFGEQEGLRGLEGRVVRGLDPAAMLAVPQTRQRLETLAESYGADMSAVQALTKDLHVGGVWAHAADLAEGSPAATVWTVAGEATVRDKTVLGDLTEEQFVDDTKRVIGLLDAALEDPQGFARDARANLIGRSKEQFTVEEGVPVSDVPGGFLAMAVNGYKSGIVRDTQNQLLFVGANELDFDEVADRRGLVFTEQEDRGRMASLYVDQENASHIKRLYPGFGIVLDGDMSLARELALTAVPPVEA